MALQEDKWLQKYELAKKFKEEYGHLSIPNKFKTFDGVNFDEKGIPLGSWLRAQRFAYKKHNLDYNKYLLLDQLGVEWGRQQIVITASWKKGYPLAVAFYEHYHHLKIPHNFKTFDGINYDPNGYNLFHFLDKQANQIKVLGDKYPESKLKQLEQIGFVSNRREDSWDNMYLIAKNFYLKHHHLKVPFKFKTIDGITYNENGKQLDRWIRHQRDLIKTNQLSEEKIEKLKAIGFIINQKKNSLEIEQICHEFGIKDIAIINKLKKLPINELFAKLSYLKENNLSIVHKEKIHQIFYMSNLNVKAKYDITVEELINKYTITKEVK